MVHYNANTVRREWAIYPGGSFSSDEVLSHPQTLDTQAAVTKTVFTCLSLYAETLGHRAHLCCVPEVKAWPRPNEERTCCAWEGQQQTLDQP